MQDGFLIVTPSNLPDIRQELEQQKGKLLLYRPRAYTMPAEKLNGDADFNLFENAKIRNGFIWASPCNHPKSREYTLRKRLDSDDALWEAAYNLFEILKLNNNYVFEIHGQFIVGFGLSEEKGAMLYIPKKEGSEENALRFTIGKFITEINAQNGDSGLCDSDLELMVNYAVDDLKTGKIWKHNIEAGQAADAMLGL